MNHEKIGDILSAILGGVCVACLSVIAMFLTGLFVHWVISTGF